MARREIADSRVLITGASSGIGRALATAFSDCRARLLLIARREEKLRSVAAALAVHEAAPVEYMVGDVTDAAVRRQIIDRADARWGGLDVLVNNAGVSAHGRFSDSDETTLRQIMEVNLFAAAELTRLALPLLRKGRQAAVVNVGSILGHRAVPLNSEYCASKFALRGWSEALRAELTRDGVDVLLVSPGTTDTEFFDHLIARRGRLPWDQAKGVSPETVARQTIRALKRGRREIYPNWRGRLLVMANRFCPGAVDRVIGRYGR